MVLEITFPFLTLASKDYEAAGERNEIGMTMPAWSPGLGQFIFSRILS